MDIVESVSTKLDELKNIKLLDNIEGKMALESGKGYIKKLLNDNILDTITAQKLSLVITKIKDNIYSDMTAYKEFQENGGESYIELLDKVINYISENIVEIFEEETNINTPQNYKTDLRMKPIGDKVDEYFEHIIKIFGISDITRKNYDVKLEKISLVGMEREKIEEILNILTPYSKDLKSSRYLHVNPIILKQLKSKISQLKNKEAEAEERQEKLKNINSIKKTIPKLLKNIEEFKKEIISYSNDEDIENFDDFKKFLKETAESLIKKNKGFLNDIKLKGDTGNNEKIKFAHKIERGISVYTTLSVDQIKTGLERGFFWGEIDELIDNLNKI